MALTEPVLLIVSGLPATGKTTLARRLADQFALPFMFKDGIKETLYNMLGCDSVEESRRIGRASVTLLYQFAETLLAAHQSYLIESYFYPDLATKDLSDLQKRCPFFPVQIHCHTELSLSIRRYRERFEAGLRHPGHRDAEYLRLSDEATTISPHMLEAIPIGGHVIELDTTDFTAIDYPALYAELATFLTRPQFAANLQSASKTRI